jgi:hypothetical protein
LTQNNLDGVGLAEDTVSRFPWDAGEDLSDVLRGEVLPLKNRNKVARNNATKTTISDPKIVSPVVSVIVVVLVTMPVTIMGLGIEVVV